MPSADADDLSPGPWASAPGRLDDALPDPGGIEIRPLATLAEFRACVALQRATWGDGFSEIVPLALLKVCQRIGGVSAGAFDADGELVGFVFGMTGIDDDGSLVHWSDMLAVRPEHRDRGLGRRLKEYQRTRMRARGVRAILWTFDPLVARNAHLNVNRLGARIVDYVPDMYGETDSPLHLGGTDRFIVSWALDPSPAPSAEVRDPPRENGDGQAPPPGWDDRWEEALLVNPSPDDASSRLAEVRPDTPLVAIRIPEDILAVQRASLDEAAAWRRTTRAAFLGLREMGFEVVGFQRAPASCRYLLAPAGGPRPGPGAHLEDPS